MAHKNVIFQDSNGNQTQAPKGFFPEEDKKKESWRYKLLLFIKKLLRV